MDNTVELIGIYGDDEIIACSAWTSTSRELTGEKKERIPKLLVYLWHNGHETPFEKGVVHFLVNCDIASHIHLLKHRMSSLNAESARYKELKEDKFYLPKDWIGIDVNEKHYNFNEQWSQIKEWLDSNLDKWDIYIGGTTIFGFHETLGNIPMVMENFDLGILRIQRAYGRHFAYYNKSIFADIINYPIERPIDDLINNHRILISYPFLAIQSASYSNITYNMVNDFDKFEHSENVIKNYIDHF
jgi:hypothetical protein